MKGQLIEYHNPSHGERFGIIQKEGKKTCEISLGWSGFNGKGVVRRSVESSFKRYSAQDIFDNSEKIEGHFKYVFERQNSSMCKYHTLMIYDSEGQPFYQRSDEAD